jgi:hypothetical protein
MAVGPGSPRGPGRWSAGSSVRGPVSDGCPAGSPGTSRPGRAGPSSGPKPVLGPVLGPGPPRAQGSAGRSTGLPCRPGFSRTNALESTDVISAWAGSLLAGARPAAVAAPARPGRPAACRPGCAPPRRSCSPCPLPPRGPRPPAACPPGGDGLRTGSADAGDIPVAGPSGPGAPAPGPPAPRPLGPGTSAPGTPIPGAPTPVPGAPGTPRPLVSGLPGPVARRRPANRSPVPSGSRGSMTGRPGDVARRAAGCPAPTGPDRPPAGAAGARQPAGPGVSPAGGSGREKAAPAAGWPGPVAGVRQGAAAPASGEPARGPVALVSHGLPGRGPAGGAPSPPGTAAGPGTVGVLGTVDVGWPLAAGTGRPRAGVKKMLGLGATGAVAAGAVPLCGPPGGFSVAGAGWARRWVSSGSPPHDEGCRRGAGEPVGVASTPVTDSPSPSAPEAGHRGPDLSTAAWLPPFCGTPPRGIGAPTANGSPAAAAADGPAGAPLIQSEPTWAGAPAG